VWADDHPFLNMQLFEQVGQQVATRQLVAAIPGIEDEGAPHDLPDLLINDLVTLSLPSPRQR